MGKYKGGIMSGFSGKVGIVTGAIGQGKSVIRTNKSKLKNKAKVVEQKQCSKFSDVNMSFNRLKTALGLYFEWLGVEVIDLRAEMFKGSMNSDVINNGRVVSALRINVNKSYKNINVHSHYHSNSGQIRVTVVDTVKVLKTFPDAKVHFARFEDNVRVSGNSSASMNFANFTRNMSSSVSGEDFNLIIGGIWLPNEKRFLTDIVFSFASKYPI